MDYLSGLTSALSERQLKYADQKTERVKVINPEYSICRDQPASRASPLRINALLYRELSLGFDLKTSNSEMVVKSEGSFDV